MAHNAGAHPQHELPFYHVMEHHALQPTPTRPDLLGHPVPGEEVRVGILAVLVPVEVLQTPESLRSLNFWFADHPPELNENFISSAIIHKSARIYEQSFRVYVCEL